MSKRPPAPGGRVGDHTPRRAAASVEAPSAALPTRARGGPGEVRLIGGQWKRSILPVLAKPGLRPTPQRLRQTLYDWLGFLSTRRHPDGLVVCRVADVFAGTGALGFEAASRGAAAVDLVEADPALAAALDRTREKLQATTVRVHRGDGIAWLARQATASLDLVLLDPPFGAGLHGPAMAAAQRVLAPGGWVYVEADRALEEPTLGAQGWTLARHTRAGAVHGHLLVRSMP